MSWQKKIYLTFPCFTLYSVKQSFQYGHWTDALIHHMRPSKNMSQTGMQKHMLKQLKTNHQRMSMSCILLRYANPSIHVLPADDKGMGCAACAARQPKRSI